MLHLVLSIYVHKKYFFVVASSSISSGHSHLGSLFTSEDHKRLAHDIIDTFDTHSSLVHDITGTDRWAQNGNTHSRVFVILFETSMFNNRVRTCSVPVYYSSPFDRVHDVCLVRFPINTGKMQPVRPVYVKLSLTLPHQIRRNGQKHA